MATNPRHYNMASTTAAEPITVVGSPQGLPVISSGSPLTRLNYFDGKFLRADDLRVEQDYQRGLIALSNQAGGSGVVHGFDTRLIGGDTIEIGAGLAIDPAGRALLLPQTITLGLSTIIALSEPVAAEPGVAPPDAAPIAPFSDDIYVISIGWVEAASGEEKVHGRICEKACLTSTDRSHLVEGIVVRATRLTGIEWITSTAFPFDQTHLRSRVASAYFAVEGRGPGSLISGAGLGQLTWCRGAQTMGGEGVPLAVVGRAGLATIFLDAWTARRERIEPPARRYWAFRMRMRPWDVFLGQVLQFQCQLRDVLASTPDLSGVDPWVTEKDLLSRSADAMENMVTFYSSFADEMGKLGLDQPPAAMNYVENLKKLKEQLLKAKEKSFQSDKILLRAGIVELPSAGYLPVTPSAEATVNDQVYKLLGEGVDLRFCVTTPDYVAHALEEAQHMDRISLVHGLDYPEEKPKVDILVPHGRMVREQTKAAGMGFETTLKLTIPQARGNKRIEAAGVGRGKVLPSGGAAFCFAGTGWLHPVSVSNVERRPIQGIWLELQVDKNPLELEPEEWTPVAGWLVIVLPENGINLMEISLTTGKLKVTTAETGRITGTLTLEGTLRDQKAANPDVVTPFDMTLELELTADPADRKVRATLTSNETANDPKRTFTSIASFSFDESSLLHIDIQVTAKETNREDDEEKELMTGDVDLQEVDVAHLQNSLHEEASSALDAIAPVLNRDGFREDAEKKLFPPDEEPIETTVVYATQDWVLFHRRRLVDCALPPEAPEPEPRRYAVYHLSWSGGIADFPAIVREGREELTRTRFVGMIDYRAASADMVSNPAAVKQAYKAVLPGETLRYAAIATNGTEDSEKLELDRLETLKKVIQGVSNTNSTTEGRFDDVPSRLVSVNSDGFILLVTNAVEQPLVTEESTIEVYGLSYNNDQELDSLVEDITENPAKAQDVLAGFMAWKLGEIKVKGSSIVNADPEQIWGTNENFKLLVLSDQHDVQAHADAIAKYAASLGATANDARGVEIPGLSSPIAIDLRRAGE